MNSGDSARPARSAYLDEGLRLFDRAEYFLAHETLEEFWISAPPEERDFLQGLIQLATGFLHYSRGNTTGARLQFAKARGRLENYPNSHHGVDVQKIRAFLEGAAVDLDSDKALVPPLLS